MLIRVLESLRSNAIAYLALVTSLLALSGGAYAAFTLPANSVGTRQIRDGAVGAKQIRNDSIAPVKLNHSVIGGTIRHWAEINAHGQVIASSGDAHELMQPSSVGNYLIRWGHDRFASQRCAVIATPVADLPGGELSGLLVTFPPGPGATGTTVQVAAMNTQGALVNLGFSIAVIC
ncbi:MAG: hypothetical protein JOZ98_15145 [Solirubrobacterales bacterium]|nr:hypothetical protein [Solirubrobacterales bacterium]MBV9424248.1 hypothetical protein [Solirubrobacterales bacterium]MBV9796794.1 hypothetical protein [Solirubrobacterales bacterium]